MNRNRRTFLMAAGAASVMAAPGLSRAQTRFPDRVMTYVVPVAPGGGSDYVARTTTTLWGKVLGATFVVENHPGGGGVIACQKTMRAAPDGYTLMQGYVSTLGTSPATRTLPYDPIRDFTPIGMIGGTPNVLVVNAALPVKNFSEFMTFMKTGSHHNYGSAGAGTLTHLLMELFKAQAGIAIEHIAYRGIAPAFTDLLGGRTQTMFAGLAAAVPHLGGGKVRAIAVTGEQRTRQYPDVPTLRELGFAGFEDILQWYGVSGPAGMAADIVTILNRSLQEALTAPGLEKLFAVEAITPMRMSPQAFDAYIRKDLARWQQVAQEQGIRLDA